MAISTVNAEEIANETDSLMIDESNDLMADDVEFENSIDNMDHSYYNTSNTLGNQDPEYDGLPEDVIILYYKFAFFKNESIYDLAPSEINWCVKNLTEIEGDEQYNISLSTFKVGDTEYTVEHYYPTMGQYGHNVYEKFNTDGYSSYDGIFYKINGNSIEDIINPVEYHVFDGEYYKLVGVMTPIVEFEEIEGEKEVYCIINNTCYKFVGATSPYVVGFFYTTTEGVDYNIIDGKYYTLNGDLIKSFVFVFFGEDEDDNDNIIRNGIYLTNKDDTYYEGQGFIDNKFSKDKIGMRYSIAPYIYVKVNGTLYKLILGTGTYNTTEEYAGEKYNVTKHNEYIVLNNQLYNFINGSVASKVNLTDNITNNLIIKAPDVMKYFGGSERFSVQVIDNESKAIANKDVKITINDKEYTRTTDSNGYASIGLNLNNGIYPTVVECDDVNTKATVTIKSTIDGKDITKIFRNDTQYYATFLDSNGNLLKNKDVTFNINGAFYTRTTNDKGVARLNINLGQGNYIITAKNPVTNEEKSNIVKVLPSIIENNNLTKYYKNDSQYVVKILNNDSTVVGAGVNVTFNINGVFYTRTTNASGYAKLNINLAPEEYIITAEYNGLRVSNKIKVLPVLSAEDLSMSFKDGSKFEAKLVDGQGNAYANQTIKFNINGVFYDRTTDDNGIARLNINLMAGKYIITSMYSNGATISNNVTISG